MKSKCVVYVIAVFCAVQCLVRAGAPVAVTVGTNSVPIVPPRGFSAPAGVAWTNGIALARGQLTQNSRRMYMADAVIASSTNEPVHLYGTSNDLRYVPTSRRELLIVQNLGDTTTVFLSIGSPAEASKGVALAPGARLELPGIQNVVYGITASGTTSVGAVELP